MVIVSRSSLTHHSMSRIRIRFLLLMLIPERVMFLTIQITTITIPITIVITTVTIQSFGTLSVMKMKAVMRMTNKLDWMEVIR